jgi:hypothetical protein
VEYGQVAKPVLLYGGGSSMSAAAQRRLARYVEGGGHLVFFQRLPISDESLRSCNLLDLRLPDGILRAPRPHRLSVRLGDRAVALSAPSFFSYERVPGEPIEAERLPDEPADQEGHHLHAGIAVGDRYVIGYRQRRGDGSLTVLGVAPDRELLAAIHAWLGYPVYCRVGGDPMRTAIFRRDHGFVLIAVNNGEEDHLAEATLDPRLFEDRVYTVRDLMRGEERRQNLFHETALRITLPRKSGTVLQIG